MSVAVNALKVAMENTSEKARKEFQYTWPNT